MSAVSVIIPTKHRVKDLANTLIALSSQAEFISELLIIDASDMLFNLDDIPKVLRGKTRIIPSEGSVCIQRNIGIKQASSDLVFLCDDDIEIQQDYLRILIDYLNTNPTVDVVSGKVLEKNNGGKWEYLYPPPSLLALIWHWIFGLSFWFDADLDRSNKKGLHRWLLGKIAKNKNGISPAGWPRNVSLTKPVNVCKIYGLGASVSRKNWLCKRPFDEVLDPSGIGDNYGLMVIDESYIHVLSSASVHHHKSPTNRIQKQSSFYRRCLALHYFMHQSPKFGSLNYGLFLWSMLGNVLYFFIRSDKAMRKASFKVLKECFLGKNPYLLASKNHLKRIMPVV